MPPMLFLVVHNNDTVLYPAPSILELFRLRDVFAAPSDTKVYRYINTQNYSDKFFSWGKDTLSWIPSPQGIGVGFGETSFQGLEMAYKIMKGEAK